MLRVLVNWVEVYTIASGDDAERLCRSLAALPAFTAHATGPAGETGPTLDVFVESDRGLVEFGDIDCGVKQVSRNPDCKDRDIVSLRSGSYPELQLNQIEVERRDLISPKWAVGILRHFLTTGQAIDLVMWPPDDWGDMSTAGEEPGTQQGKGIPF